MSKVKDVINQFVVCGEVVDFKNVKEGEKFLRYDLIVDVNGEQHTLFFQEFKTKFDGSENKRYTAMLTVYNNYRAKAYDNEGEKIRATGKVNINRYINKDGEIVEGLRLKVDYITHMEENEKHPEDFEPCAVFNCVGYIDKIEKESDEKVSVDVMVNDFKYNGKIKGHMVKMLALDENAIAGVESMFKEKMIIPIGCKISDVVETKFLPEDKTKELPMKEMIGFGTGLQEIKEYNEWAEKENERRAKLREEGIQIHNDTLVITGCTAPISEEEVVERELPYEKYDLDDMLNAYDDEMDKLRNEVAMKNIENINDGIPF